MHQINILSNRYKVFTVITSIHSPIKWNVAIIAFVFGKGLLKNNLKQNNSNKISNTRAYFDVLIAIAFTQVNYGCHKLYPSSTTHFYFPISYAPDKCLKVNQCLNFMLRCEVQFCNDLTRSFYCVL